MEKRKKHIEKYVAAGLSVFLTFAALMGTSCEVKDNGNNNTTSQTTTQTTSTQEIQPTIKELTIEDLKNKTYHDLIYERDEIHEKALQEQFVVDRMEAELNGSEMSYFALVYRHDWLVENSDPNDKEVKKEIKQLEKDINDIKKQIEEQKIAYLARKADLMVLRNNYELYKSYIKELEEQGLNK